MAYSQQLPIPLYCPNPACEVRQFPVERLALEHCPACGAAGDVVRPVRYPVVKVARTGQDLVTAECQHSQHARVVADEALRLFRAQHPGIEKRSVGNDGWRTREVLRSGDECVEVVIEFGPAPEVRLPEPVAAGVGDGRQELWG